MIQARIFLIIVALSAFFVGFFVSSTLSQTKYQALRADFEKYKADVATASDKAAREAEHRLEREIHTNTEIQNALDEQTKRDALTITDLRARFERVRIPTRCPSTPSVPQASDPVVPGGAPGDGGRPIEIDGTDFIEYSSRTAEMKAQYVACRQKLLSLQNDH